MSISEKLTEAMSSHEVFHFHVFGFKIIVTDTIIIMWAVMLFLVLLSVFLTRNMKLIPEGKQNVAETIVELINTMTKGSIGHHWRPFAPYLGTILLFLVVSNTIGIFNIIPFHGEVFRVRPPTKNINVTVAMALMTMIIVLGSELRIKGLRGWIKSFYSPPINLFLKPLDYGVRPLSLSLRLFGNIMGAFIVMELLYLAVPTPLAYPSFFSFYFDLFDGMLQAYVFVFLSSLYIAEAIE